MAFFVLHQRLRKYRLVLLAEDPAGNPLLVSLEESEGLPNRRFVSTVPSGKLPVSRSVWRHGGPKSIELCRNAIMAGTFESAACVYYWEPGERAFRQQWISD